MKNLEYYMNLKYSYLITPILEDDGERYFQLSIPELPGFNIYEDSKEELLNNLDDAKKAWFSANLSEHRTIPEPKKDETVPEGMNDQLTVTYSVSNFPNEKYRNLITNVSGSLRKKGSILYG